MINQTNLTQYYGTMQYYRWSVLFPNMLLTDGAKYVADNGGAGGAYWLMDAIASHQPELLKKHEDAKNFQHWRLTKSGDCSAVLSCIEGTDLSDLASQEIEYTDFDMDSIDFYVCPVDETQYVIMLPSEY